MTKGPILLAASFIANVVLAFFLTTFYLESQDYIQCAGKNKQLYVELSRSNKLLNKKTDEMAACVKAIVGAESDFDQLYHSVETASRVEMTFYIEDIVDKDNINGGLPRRIVIMGCESGEK